MDRGMMEQIIANLLVADNAVIQKVVKIRVFCDFHIFSFHMHAHCTQCHSSEDLQIEEKHVFGTMYENDFMKKYIRDRNEFI